MRIHFPLVKAGLSLLAATLGVLTSGCATPKTIDGRQVVATRWVDGKLVYVLAPPDAAEKTEIRQEADALRKLNDETWAAERSAEKPKK
ncbi:hypothetical protein [Oleiharenicola lentus]|uniref:hypothetical protein n=1 Tax=Oleiharenicola lentus TaxID=2508720 RepID=UPI003F66A154